MEAVIRKQTSFRLREDLLKVLQEEAKKANRSLNNYVESMLMDAVYSEPNEETKAAIKEARTGKYAGTINTSSLEAFIKSCKEWRHYAIQHSSKRISKDTGITPAIFQ